jgi:hypothetical protein
MCTSEMPNVRKTTPVTRRATSSTNISGVIMVVVMLRRTAAAAAAGGEQSSFIMKIRGSAGAFRGTVMLRKED